MKTTLIVTMALLLQTGHLAFANEVKLSNETAQALVIHEDHSHCARLEGTEVSFPPHETKVFPLERSKDRSCDGSNNFLGTSSKESGTIMIWNTERGGHHWTMDPVYYTSQKTEVSVAEEHDVLTVTVKDRTSPPTPPPGPAECHGRITAAGSCRLTLGPHASGIVSVMRPDKKPGYTTFAEDWGDCRYTAVDTRYDPFLPWSTGSERESVNLINTGGVTCVVRVTMKLMN